MTPGSVLGRSVAAALALALVTAWSAPQALAERKEAAAKRDEAKKREERKSESRVGRFVGAARRPASGGAPALYVTVALLRGGSQLTLMVPNRPGAKEGTPPQPDPTMVAEIKELKKGDLVRVESQMIEGRPALRSIVSYSMKEGEDDPMGYIFRGSDTEKKGTQEFLVVRLEKFGEEAPAVVPNVKGDAGKMEPDPAMAVKVQELKIGDVIEAEVVSTGQQRLLKYIGPYMPPVEGEFVKVAEQDGPDGGKTAGVEVKVGGQSQTFTIPTRGKGKQAQPDSNLLSAAKRFKEGDLVEVKTRQEGDKTVVNRIEKAKPKAKTDKADKPLEGAAARDEKPGVSARPEKKPVKPAENLPLE